MGYKMSYHSKIKILEETYLNLNTKIDALQKSENSDKEELQKMISQRTKYLSELSRFRKLQWEEDHERVEFDDDR